MLYIQPEGCIPDRYRSTPLDNLKLKVMGKIVKILKFLQSLQVRCLENGADSFVVSITRLYATNEYVVTYKYNLNISDDVRMQNISSDLPLVECKNLGNSIKEIVHFLKLTK